jgi:hypothetical protein
MKKFGQKHKNIEMLLKFDMFFHVQIDGAFFNTFIWYWS